MMKEVSHICHHLVIIGHYPVLHGMLKSIKETQMRKLLYLAATFICLYVGALINISFFNTPEYSST